VERAGASLEECVLELAGARKEWLARAAAQLEALSPLSALRRGYAVPLSPEGRVLRSAGEFEPGAPFRLRVVDGSVECRVEGQGSGAAGAGQKRGSDGS